MRKLRLIVLICALIVASCGGSAEGEPVVGGSADTSRVTTTEPVVTTTTTTPAPVTTPSTTTTTTMPTTTTTEVVPPESGFYIVDEVQYPEGIRFSVGDFGNVPGDRLGGVGYLLVEGSRVLAPFDGYFDNQGTGFIAGQTVSAGLFVDDETGNILMDVYGNSLTFSEYGPKRKGDVLAVVTNPSAIMVGLKEPANVLLGLSSFSVATNYYELDEALMRAFFSFLP